jgi:hypothetical protein
MEAPNSGGRDTAAANYQLPTTNYGFNTTFMHSPFPSLRIA